MPIRALEPKVISRIAAGEVVERPASVVKELLENSLDASSSQISVEVRSGGVSLIRVTDNGCGIPAEEVGLAFQRYATSKIGSLDDLESISSLGFRGEALPSITAVAEVEIITCTANQTAGTYLSLKNGTVVNNRKRGHPQGTTVMVRNLFCNLPARLKFLKSSATENSHIANVVIQYALVFPEVRFSLSIDGRVALRTTGNGKLIDCVIQVYGVGIARNMLDIGANKDWEGSVSSLSVTGMVGSPVLSRSSRDYLSFFINRRWINSRLLARAVQEGYHGILMSGKYPVAIINVSVPPGELDINIHPSKTEVKFQNESAIFSAVQRAVQRVLIERGPVPKIEEITTTYGVASKSALELKLPDPSPSSPVVEPTLAFSLPALRLLGQLSASYIVAEGPDGLYLVDQHAAHERIIYERVRHQVTHQEIEVQGLLEPKILEVNPKQEEILKYGLEYLDEFGFSIEPFGKRTYLVRAVPALLSVKDWLEMLWDLLDSPWVGHNSWVEKVTVSVACHGAVRAGQVLTDEEMRELLRALEKTTIPNTCPHGRPTMISLSSGQLENEFRRS
ncbi:DNA mismatch repair endonuclease MutL [Chloroflexota bacterium]